MTEHNFLGKIDEDIIKERAQLWDKIFYSSIDPQEVIDQILRISKNRSSDIIEYMFQTFYQESVHLFLRKSIIKNGSALLEHIKFLPEIPHSSNDNDAIGYVICKIMNSSPELVINFIFERAELALGNSSIIILNMPNQLQRMKEILKNNNSGKVFFKRMKKKINEWLKDKKDYPYFKEVALFLHHDLLGVPYKPPHKGGDEKEGKDFFEPVKSMMHELLSGTFNKKEITKKMIQIYRSIKETNQKLENLNKEERIIANDKWQKSVELKKFNEEIRPLYDVFISFKDLHIKPSKKYLSQGYYVKIIHPKICSKRYYIILSQMETKLKTGLSPKNISFCGTSEKYDGLIEFESGDKQKIEVTLANRSEEFGLSQNQLTYTGISRVFAACICGIAFECLQAILKKLDPNKHQDKYKDCLLLINIVGWNIKNTESLEEFLHFFFDAVSRWGKEVDWAKVQAILFYFGRIY